MDNISVAIRVRPLVERELLREAENHWQVNCNTIYQVENGIPVPSNPINPTTFVFDKVYSGYESTESVYNQFAKPLVFKAMEGFNGTIFAYGQTGTGKTYTMMGEATNPGVTPRTINDIFAMVQMAPDREFLIRVSYMEIYNEVITDLLKSDGSNLKIRNNERNEIFVENLCEVPISSPEDALSCLESGEQRRRFGVTNMNEKSSRSHTIFRITIESKLANADESVNEDGAVIVSQLNLVDLAGSERAAQTGAQGTRLKESGYINKSLLALGTVISKLSSAGDERAFIPYRDSKLTRILQNSLGGNAKTSVIATVSSAAGEETFSTLKFASRAKTIKNKPTVNEILDGDTMIRRYRKEINMLKRQINEINDGTKMEKMEQLLEENEQKRREQELKINGLQKLIISASEQTICWKRKASSKLARRETWCPGKQKRSLGVALLDGIIDEESEDDDVSDTAFPDSKSDFLKELDREERRSCEEFKRKRSKDIYQDPMVKFRGSFQSISTVEAKVDQSCQTETTEAASSSNLCEEQDIVGDEREKVKILSDENAELKETIERLTLHLSELEAKSSPLEGKGERATSDRVGTRRRGGLTTPYLPPSAKKKRQLPTMDIDTSWSEAAIHVMSQGLRNDSLLNFEMLEKDMEIEDLHGKLKEAQDTINDLKRSKTELDQTSVKLITESPVEEISSPESSGKENQLTTALDAKVKQLENAIEDMQYKIDEIELENMALKEKDRKNESHLELLAKENLELQLELKTGANDELKSEDPDAQLVALQKEKEELMRELEDERSLRRSFEDKELEKVELQKQIEDLKSLNEGLLDGISYKKTSIEEMENKAKLMEDDHSMELEELRQELVDLKAVNEDLCKKIKSGEESTEEDESSRSETEDIKNIKLNAVEIEERNVKLVKENLELLKKMEDNHAEKCLLEGELHELSLKFTQLEKLNEELQEKTVEIVGQNMEDHLNHDSEKREVEKLMIRLDELEEMSQKLQEEVSVKDKLLEEASNRTNEEVEEMKLNVLELEKFNKELLESRENMMGWNVSEEKGGEADKLGIMVSGSKECSDNLEKDDGMRSSLAEDKRDSHDIELEALMLKLKELEERNEELVNEVVNKNSILEKEDNRTQEELKALQLQLAEVEKRNEELLNEVVDKNSLLEKEDNRTQEELKALQLQLAEVEKRNEELLNEVVDKNSLLEKEDDRTQEELKALQLQLAEVEKRNEELLNEVVDKNSLLEKEDDRTQEELKALQLQLAEVEKRNEELLNEVVDKNSLLEKEDDRTQEELKALQLQLAEVEKRNEELLNEVVDKNAILGKEDDRTQEELKALQLQLAEVEKRNEELLNEVVDKNSLLEKEDDRTQEELKALQLQLAEVEKRNEELLNEVVDKNAILEKEDDRTQEDLKALQLQLAEVEKRNEELLNEVVDKNSLLEKEDDRTQEELKALQLQLAEVEKRNEELLNEVVDKNSLLEKEDDRTQEELKALQLQLAEVEKRNEELLNEVVDKNSLLEKEDDRTQEELKALQLQLAEVEKRNEELQAEILVKDMKVLDLQSRMKNEDIDEMKLKLRKLNDINDDFQKQLFEKEILIQKQDEEASGRLAEGEEMRLKLIKLEGINEELRADLRKLRSNNEEDSTVNLLKSEFEELKSKQEMSEGTEEASQNIIYKMEDVKSLKDEFAEIDDTQEGDESYNGVIENLTIKIMELEEQNEALLVKIVAIDLVEKEKNELLEKLSIQSEEMHSLEDEKRQLVEKLKDLEIEKEDVMCRESFSQELKTEMFRRDEVEDMKIKLLEIETENENLRKAVADEDDVEVARNRLIELENANKQLSEELDLKCALLQEKQMAAVDHSAVKEEFEMQLVELKAKNEQLNLELVTMCELLEGQRENMKNFVQIEEAEELRSQVIELQMVNEELSQELSKKTDVIDECNDINEMNKKKIANLELVCKQLNEDGMTKSSLVVHQVEGIKGTEETLTEDQGNVEKIVRKFEDLGSQNEDFCKELHSKSTLLEEREEEAYLDDSLVREKRELEDVLQKLVSLEALNKDLRKELDTKSFLLAEKEEEMKNCIKIKSAEELRLKFIELEETNEELRLELSQKEELIKEQGDINEILKNSAELEKSNQELREEISSKSMLLKEMEEKLKAAEVIIVCERDNAEEAVGKLRLFEERNQELHKEVVSKCDLMKELENANEELCLELNQKEELRKEIMKRITELEEANEELHEKINSKSMFLIEVEEKLRTAGTSLGCEKEKVEEAGKKLKMFEERNEELNKEIVSMCDLLKEKEEELNIARNCNLEAKWKSEAMEKKLGELELLNEDLLLEIKTKCDLIQGKDLEMERYVHIEKLEEARGMCRDLEAKNDELCEKIERGLILIAEKEEQSKLYFRNAEECQLKLTEIVSENKELREEIARKKEMLCENRDEENMKSVVAGMEAENSELKIAMDEKETEISLLKSRVEDFQQRMEEERRLQENALKEKESVAQQSEVFKSEIENLKVEINELKEELRVTNYEKYKYLTLEAQENSELNDKVYELNKQIEKERAAAKEKIASVKKYFSEEAKKRRGEVCIGVALEKENIKLKEKLERSEQERISYEEYQEKRVTGLKSELKKLQEMLADVSNVAGNGHAKLRNVVDNAALFTLKADKANLERENGKLKGTVEDLTKKNASLAFEKYNLESKFESVKAECYKVKRSVRGETFDVQTQTESIWSRSTHRPEAVFRGQENKKREVAPFDEQFQLYTKKDEEPGQCTQQ